MHAVIIVGVTSLVRLVCCYLSVLDTARERETERERERERFTTVHDSGDKEQKREAADRCEPVIQSKHTVKDKEANFFILRDTESPFQSC